MKKATQYTPMFSSPSIADEEGNEYDIKIGGHMEELFRQFALDYAQQNPDCPVTLEIIASLQDN